MNCWLIRPLSKVTQYVVGANLAVSGFFLLHWLSSSGRPTAFCVKSWLQWRGFRHNTYGPNVFIRRVPPQASSTQCKQSACLCTSGLCLHVCWAVPVAWLAFTTCTAPALLAHALRLWCCLTLSACRAVCLLLCVVSSSGAVPQSTSGVELLCCCRRGMDCRIVAMYFHVLHSLSHLC